MKSFAAFTFRWRIDAMLGDFLRALFLGDHKSATDSGLILLENLDFQPTYNLNMILKLFEGVIPRK